MTSGRHVQYLRDLPCPPACLSHALQSHLALPAVDQALADVLHTNALDELTDLRHSTAQHAHVKSHTHGHCCPLCTAEASTRVARRPQLSPPLFAHKQHIKLILHSNALNVPNQLQRRGPSTTKPRKPPLSPKFHHTDTAAKKRPQHHTAATLLTLSSYTRARRAPKKSMDWPGKVSTRISTSPRLTCKGFGGKVQCISSRVCMCVCVCGCPTNSACQRRL